MDHYKIKSFAIKNYKSFYDEQIVNFDDNQPIMAFYGANASGKSNFFSALTIFYLFVHQSTNPDMHGVPYMPFLLREGANSEPSVFTIIFHNSQEEYKYSFSLQDDKVIEEEMYDLSSSRPRTIFVRSKGPTEQASKNGFGKKMFEGNDAAREDSLLITLAQRTTNKYANALFSALNSITTQTATTEGNLMPNAVEILQQHPDLYDRIIKLLSEADFTITGMTYSITKITPDMLIGTPFATAVKDELIKNGKSVIVNTAHTVRNAQSDKVGSIAFDMDRQESIGTQIFFCLIIMAIHAIDNGKLLYLDEFGSSLHTNICQFLIKLFQREGVKTGAKLIINTHDVGLIKNGILGVLSKNDIMLVERDRWEQSKITPLKERVKRPDENISKKYTLGIYGGIPILEETE